ncbi:MAG TPA: hypothetical protein VGS10_11505 [Terracidiphilus sp.]|nr:hypothetical protein [Terracidiphilus sp.]
MALKRLKNWDTQAYHDFLVSAASTHFVWGEFDCSLFAADGIKAITGVDIADDFRGKYSDQASAFALIKSVTGGSTVADAAAYCAKKHGLTERVHPLMAQRGDLVVFHGQTGDLVAGLVHLSGRHIVAVGDKGLYRFPISAVQRAWSY